MRSIGLLLIGFIYSIEVAAVSDSIFMHYQLLNDSETRLAEFKDSDEILKKKIEQFDYINKTRKKHKLTILKLDILASRVANQICKESAENNYLGHWNLAGEKPYHRYAFAGGVDHIGENGYSREGTGVKGTEDPLLFMKEGFDAFMSEKPPQDLHRKNCLLPAHNYVGLGYFLSKGKFRYYEEYVDRYLEFSNVASTAKPGESISFSARPPEKLFINMVVVFYEKPIQKMSPSKINSRSSYKDYGEKRFATLAAWELQKFMKNGVMDFKLKLDKAGLYYFHIYLDKKDFSKAKKVDTAKMIQASGIVIKVQ